jgi:hypothetical protein
VTGAAFSNRTRAGALILLAAAAFAAAFLAGKALFATEAVQAQVEPLVAEPEPRPDGRIVVVEKKAIGVVRLSPAATIPALAPPPPRPVARAAPTLVAPVAPTPTYQAPAYQPPSAPVAPRPAPRPAAPPPPRVIIDEG